MNEAKFKIKYIFFILAVFICHTISYAKTIDLNGVKVSLTAEVVKKELYLGYNVNENNDFSTTEYEKEKREREDRYVKTALSIRNNNPYEAATVTIEEILPSGFRQLEDNKNEKIINVKIDAKSEKTYKYKYRYHENFLKGHYNSILYDDDGNIIDKNENVEIDKKDRKNILTSKNKGRVEEEVEDLKKGAGKILLFFLAFVICVVLLMAVLMLYKTIKGNNDSFFDSVDEFKVLIIFTLVTVIISIRFSKTAFASKIYEPQVYEHGKIYEKVVYESLSFNDRLYRFAYKISFTYDDTYEITYEDYGSDTDGDLLVDAFEYQYMTDKNNVDTDGDGISDYIEVMILDYNPLSDNTFNDEIKDSDRDFDNDKLTNIEEVRLETDLSNVDTDYDSLSDYDEVNVYNTNPLSVDTDEDLLTDSDELKLGLNPTIKKTDGVTLDSERKIEQEYNMQNVPEDLRKGDVFISRIKGNISGNIDNEIKITKKNEEVFNRMSSFVHSGFKVDMKNNEWVEITLDVDKISDRKTALVVVKYENNSIEAVNTFCENNSLKVNVGAGTYTVMDSEIVLRDLNVYIKDYMP